LLRELVAAAAQESADLLVLPELFLGGYIMQNIKNWALPLDAPVILEACAAAKSAGVGLVFGFPELDGDCVYNTSLAVSRDGEVLQTYRKSHLYGPAERAAFTVGDRLCPAFSLPLAGGGMVQCALIICYDVEFPEVVREMALQGCELVVCITANTSSFIHTHMVPVRAFENSLALVYCNYGDFVSEEDVHFCGLSCVSGAGGEQLLIYGEGEDGLKVVEVPLGKERLRESKSASPDSEYLRDRRPDLYTRSGAQTGDAKPGVPSSLQPAEPAGPAGVFLERVKSWM
jgi:predicted amidohydrolase